MKESGGELSLTAITMVSISAVLFAGLFLLNNGFNLIEQVFLGKPNNNAQTEKTESIVSKVSIKKDEYYENSINNSLEEKLGKDIVPVKKDSEEISLLEKETNKIAKKIENNPSVCINKCSSLNKNNMDYSYYKTNKGYIVTIEDDNNRYAISYENKKNIFGQKDYSTTVYNEKDTIKKSIDIGKSLEKSENEKSDLNINYEYMEDYVSKIASNEKEKFSNNKDLPKQILETNKNSIVTLNTYTDGKITNNGNGFFISDYILVTSSEYLKESIQDNGTITAITPDNKPIIIQGIISMDLKNDIALLKTEDKVTPVTLNKAEVGEELLLLGSNTGFSISGTVGICLGNNDIQTISMYSQKKDAGSPIFNSKGEVTGIITHTKENASITESLSYNILNSYKKMYNDINPKNIQATPLQEITQEFYSYSLTQEKKERLDETNILWKKYSKYIDLEKLISVDLVKYSGDNNKISLRYKNTTNFDNDLLLKPVIQQLKDNNYKELLNTNKKKKYIGKSSITIYYDFDYIILLVKEE